MIWGKIYAFFKLITPKLDFYKSKGNKREDESLYLSLLSTEMHLDLKKNNQKKPNPPPPPPPKKSEKTYKHITVFLSSFWKEKPTISKQQLCTALNQNKVHGIPENVTLRAEAEMSQHYTCLIKAGNFTLCCLANNYTSWKDLPRIEGGKPILRRHR